jgi:hypothetical protein
MDLDHVKPARDIGIHVPSSPPISFQLITQCQATQYNLSTRQAPDRAGTQSDSSTMAQ